MVRVTTLNALVQDAEALSDYGAFAVSEARLLIDEGNVIDARFFIDEAEAARSKAFTKKEYVKYKLEAVDRDEEELI